MMLIIYVCDCYVAYHDKFYDVSGLLLSLSSLYYWCHDHDGDNDYQEIAVVGP